MKKLICLSVFLLIAVQLGSADQIFFQPQTQSGNVGDNFFVDVMYSGAAAPWLGGYDIDIGFVSAILQPFSVSWGGDFLGLSTLHDTIMVSPGLANVYELSFSSVSDLGTLQSVQDPFRLFTFQFMGLAPGTSPLTFDRVDLSDGNGALFSPAGAPAGSITINGPSVREPAEWFMLIPMLSGLAFLRFRKCS